MDKKLRVFKLRNKTEEDLTKGLEGLKKELSELRVSKVSGGTATKLGRISHINIIFSVINYNQVVRKSIAKYLTVINQKLRDKVREEFKGKSKLPRDLRVKKTRAIRKRMSKSQTRIQTLRQWKKVTNFPLRKYTLKE